MVARCEFCYSALAIMITMAKQGRYGIDVFCKHFSVSGKPWVPPVVAEIGPGPNKGAGIAALMLGAKQYWSFEHSEQNSSNRQNNVQIATEIYDALQNDYWPNNASTEEVANGTEPAPEDTYWGPKLGGDIPFPYYYPSMLQKVDKDTLNDRLEAVLAALEGNNNTEAAIMSLPAWLDYDQSDQEEKFDFVWSHAVMEHMEDVIDCYCTLTSMMKQGGVQSHQIDHTSHGLADEVNGHYAWTRPFWEKRCATKGDGKINSLPPSFHRAVLTCFGNKIRITSCVMRRKIFASTSWLKIL